MRQRDQRSVIYPNSLRNGFTFLEILLTVALLSIAVLAGTHISEMLTSAKRLGERRSNSVALISLISQRLNDPGLCKESLGGGSGLNNSRTSASTTLKIRVPGIATGVGSNAEVLTSGKTVDAFRVSIEKLTLGDSKPISPQTFFGNVWMQLRDSDSQLLSPDLVAPIVYDVDGAGTIVSCRGNAAASSQELCVAMGCTFDPMAMPRCKCSGEVVKSCSGLSLPVSYEKDGTPVCQTLGGSTCGASEYVTGVHLGGVSCRPLASSVVSCPAGTGPTGLGSVLPAPNAGCRCLLSDQVWDGAACHIPLVSCPLGASTTGSGGLLPAPNATCRCSNAGEQWNGSACGLNSLRWYKKIRPLALFVTPAVGCSRTIASLEADFAAAYPSNPLSNGGFGSCSTLGEICNAFDGPTQGVCNILGCAGPNFYTETTFFCQKSPASIGAQTDLPPTSPLCKNGPFPGKYMVVSNIPTVQSNGCATGLARCLAPGELVCEGPMPDGTLFDSPSGHPSEVKLTDACQSGVSRSVSYFEAQCIAKLPSGSTYQSISGCSGSAWEPVPSNPAPDLRCVSGQSACSAIMTIRCQ